MLKWTCAKCITTHAINKGRPDNKLSGQANKVRLRDYLARLLRLLRTVLGLKVYYRKFLATLEERRHQTREKMKAPIPAVTNITPSKEGSLGRARGRRGRISSVAAQAPNSPKRMEPKKPS